MIKFYSLSVLHVYQQSRKHGVTGDVSAALSQRTMINPSLWADINLYYSALISVQSEIIIQFRVRSSMAETITIYNTVSSKLLGLAGYFWVRMEKCVCCIIYQQNYLALFYYYVT